MRTESPSPLASSVARFRAGAGRARRWVASLGPATRVGLLVGGLGLVVAVGYVATLDDPAGPNWAWLYENRRLSADSVAAIAEALDAEGIVFASDSAAGRVGVKPEAKAQALAVLAKHKAVPLTLEALMGKDDEAGSPFEGSEERERRAHALLERSLKIQIEGLDTAITSAFVRVNRTRVRGGLNAQWNVGAYVNLRTEGNRPLSNRAVDGIQRFLTGEVPDLKPEAITVVDQTGRAYMATGNPMLKEQMQAHAREEEWREQITEGLRDIHGVGVSVLLETVATPPPPPPEPVPAPAAEMVVVNRPVEVGPEVVPAPAASPTTPPPASVKARVWVRVPRSFYLIAAQYQWPTRHPSPEDFQAMKETTERLIRHAVEAHIPRDILGVVTIDTVQDDLGAARTLILPSAGEARRLWPLPALYGGLGVAAVALAVAALVRLAAARRPSSRPAPSAWRAGFVADGPSGPVPGPSERVRDLIRTSPEAAAGVLQRWIGQGGTAG